MALRGRDQNQRAFALQENILRQQGIPLHYLGLHCIIRHVHAKFYLCYGL